MPKRSSDHEKVKDRMKKTSTCLEVSGHVQAIQVTGKSCTKKSFARGIVSCMFKGGVAERWGSKIVGGVRF